MMKKIAVSLVAIAAGAGVAAATDTKHYPGVLCTATGANISRIERPSTGGANNLGPGQLFFQCPAVKDYKSISSAVVHVFDQNPGSNVEDNVTCTLRSRVADATIDIDTRATAGSSTDPKTLSFPSQDEPAPFGYYILRCDIPAPVTVNGLELRSGVALYTITEAE
jgi:hypothetical protein